jgi:tetratricopeptide (TPR) repeat protein
MSVTSSSVADVVDWAGLRVGVVGRLAAGTKREARKLLKQRGAELVDDWSGGLDLVVVGEHDLAPVDLGERLDALPEPERSQVRVLSETELWQALDDADAAGRQVHRLYTPAMLAELLNVAPAVVRRWHRRGLITPARIVRRLPYFDFQEVSTARRLAELLAGGATPQAIERQLAGLARLLPGVDRPLAQLSVIIEGRGLLLRQGEGLLEPGGQYRFDFEALDDDAPATLSLPTEAERAAHEVDVTDASPEATARAAATCEDDDRLEEAADLYRAALAAGGPNAEYNFQLADVLYRLGDLGAARERYLAAIEIDEDYVEARANVGCILAEQGRLDLAVAAFEGALKYHDSYPDAHYHLARLLDDAGQTAAAETHWRSFLDVVSNGPWADNARRRLGLPAASESGNDE